MKKILLGILILITGCTKSEITFQVISTPPLLIEQIVPIPSLKEGLVAYYPFNGNTNDSSNYKNNGISNGAILTTDRFGKVNSAYSFNGYSEIIAPNQNYLNITNNISISAWFNPAQSPTFRTSYTIVTKRISMNVEMPYLLAINYQYGINSDYEKPIFISNSNYYGYQYLQSSFSITNSKWQHLVCTINDNNLKIYLNGIQILNTIIDNNKRIPNTGMLIIGGGARADKPAEQFIGSLDEIRIYNKALDQTEINYLYNH